MKRFACFTVDISRLEVKCPGGEVSLKCRCNKRLDRERSSVSGQTRF